MRESDPVAPHAGTNSSRAASTPLHNDPFFRVGDIVSGRYRIIRFVAEGGMGEVYEAEDSDLHEQVALKLVRPDIARDPDAVERFKREVQLARRVTHPNICRIFDVGHHRATDPRTGLPIDIPFLSMEMLRGETLATRLDRQGRLNENEALPIIAQIASALDAAHQVGVVHRDFKTGNVMLVPDPGRGVRVVVTDFGLARIAAGYADMPPSMTATGVVMGTPTYMAPEQVVGGSITAATDIYALGVVMYEMITGKLPFAGDSALSTAAKRLTTRPSSPAVHVPSLSPLWEAAILRCLERQPEDRFATASDVVRALGGEPVALAPRTIVFRRRRRITWSLSILAIMAMAGGAAYWLHRRSTPEARPSPPLPSPTAPLQNRQSVAILGFRNTSGRPENAWLSTAIAEMLTSELAAGQKLRIIPGENVARAQADLSVSNADSFASDSVARVRANLGADLLVLGSYLRQGEQGQIRIDYRVQDAASGEIIIAAPESGTDLFSVVSRVGARLRGALGAGELTVSERGMVQASVPSNPAAVEYYSQGLDRLRRYDARGARDLLLKAVAAEPQFPLAHTGLAAALSALGYDGRAVQEARKAYELSAGLSREDRLMVEGRYRETMREWGAAVDIYKSLFAFFPDNLEYGLRLAMAQIASGRPQEAWGTIAQLKRLAVPAGEDARIDLAEAEAARAISDFRRMMTAATAAIQKGSRTGARSVVARGRIAEAWSWYNLGDLEKAKEAYRESRVLYEQSGDQVAAAVALQGLATILWRQGSLDAAEKMYREALEVHREAGDMRGLSIALNHLANIANTRGDLVEGRARYEESIAIRREIGDKRGVGVVLGNLGVLLRDSGDIAAAQKLFDEELVLARELGNKNNIAVALVHMAVTSMNRGDLEAASRVYAEARALTQETGDREFWAATTNGLGTIMLYQGKTVEARKYSREALAAFTAMGDTGSVPEYRVRLAIIDNEEGRFAEAEKAGREVSGDARRAGNSDIEAWGLSVLAEALLEQKKTDELADALDRIVSLVVRVDEGSLSLGAFINASRLLGRTGRLNEAARLTARLAPVVQKRGTANEKFELELALGVIELSSGKATAGRSRLEQLQKQAHAKGFELISRKAASALSASR